MQNELETLIKKLDELDDLMDYMNKETYNCIKAKIYINSEVSNYNIVEGIRKDRNKSQEISFKYFRKRKDEE